MDELFPLVTILSATRTDDLARFQLRAYIQRHLVSVFPRSFRLGVYNNAMRALEWKKSHGNGYWFQKKLFILPLESIHKLCTNKFLAYRIGCKRISVALANKIIHR